MHSVLNTVAFGLIGLFVLIAFVFTISACPGDARRRGKSPVMVTLAVLVFFPVGLIAWILFRPDRLDGGGPPPFRLKDHRLQ
jgi:hypothetical protein